MGEVIDAWNKDKQRIAELEDKVNEARGAWLISEEGRKQLKAVLRYAACPNAQFNTAHYDEDTWCTWCAHRAELMGVSDEN